ncbi:MAG: hypothetical protein ACD_16C00221G0009 [uncultured bacterium]|nr:MAG: hypothetical protein ACD_16C00221G0009 [uncultured bacterium]OFW68730.1 MAG: hypothetical protein A2X70_03300 [Alphaproteobacteria bacterium GWC2_42_16]OFW73360.1 MAG: hypothetical protein A2Z80_02440 [Alphaproteobacteria bacterium GWA2_41_27]OFW81821.1 MAG: hypothetical protein A3E50_02185 [Alphaproteobacteria bacterium RIFCSPHIGHO2_12_FULL_42_100]OFW85722.1 MAG: hypothetical protein A2W06_04225 [Alphaproteobacteria bacterium RBG_16_42_14]OFW90866.1 MAG: hypothetical protein A3C41_036
MNKPFAQKIHEEDVDSCKKWLCDTRPINVKKGLRYIVSLNSLYGPLCDDQIINLNSKLTMDIMSAERLLTRGQESSSEKEDRDRLFAADGIVTIDDIVTIDPSDYAPYILYHRIRSRPKFVKLIYQYMSYFPVALFEAYTEITGENLILDDLSVVREFYKNCSSFDSWTTHQLCAIISHCDPEVLDFIAENPKESSVKFSRIFTRSDLYEKNLPLVKAAVLGEAFEFIHVDRDNWVKSSLKPKKGLEWAIQKGIDYHPALGEYLLTLNTTPVISSGYTTPYLEMMKEVIRELEISRENQEKKEAIAAVFEKKLNDHKLTPPSQKLADAMATLVRLPESQQGRAKRKG